MIEVMITLEPSIAMKVLIALIASTPTKRRTVCECAWWADIWASGSRVQGSGFRVQGSGVGVQSLGLGFWG